MFCLTLISRTFHSLIAGTAGSLFHWKYTPTTDDQNWRGSYIARLTIAEQDLWILPLIWPELPCLASGHYADDTVPEMSTAM